MTLTFSFTALRDEENCPEAFRSITVLKRFKKSFTKAMTGGTDAHTAIEHRVKHQIALPPEHAQFEPLVASFERQGPLEAELALAVNHRIEPVPFWGGSGVGFQTTPLLRGKYDVVVRNREKRKALMADWKTGNDRYENPLQLEIGALLLFAADPEIDTVVGLNVYTRTAKPGRTYAFQRAETSPRWGKLLKRMREIELRDAAVEWEKRPSGLCPWCPVESCVNFQGGKGRT